MAIEIVDYEGMLSTLPLPLSSSLSNANDNNAISICQVSMFSIIEPNDFRQAFPDYLNKGSEVGRGGGEEERRELAV